LDETLVEGTVTETLPNALYKVQLASGQSVVAHVSPRLRMPLVRILAGDKVTVELSPYDLGRGSIIKRGAKT
jgi:translation initiation factor IF-1